MTSDAVENEVMSSPIAPRRMSHRWLAGIGTDIEQATAALRGQPVTRHSV